MIQISDIPGIPLLDAIERAKAGENIMIVSQDILEERIKRIAREAFGLHRPANLSYTTSAPTELEEGKAALMDDGINRRIYVKIDGTDRYVALT